MDPRNTSCETPSTRVWVFFYGTFMQAKVLREFGIDCAETFPCRVDGYRLTVRPRVNLSPCRSARAYGSLAHVTHCDLEHLYGELDERFGISYLPFPVIAQLEDGAFRPALCYLSFDISDAPADPAYVEELAQCAAALGAPETYLDHIRSFRSGSPVG